MERMLRLAFVLSCSVWLVGLSAAAAQEGSPASVGTILAEVEAKYASIDRIQASFKQASFNAAMDKEQTASGVYYAEKPGKVRWDYDKPDEQHLVISGGKVLFYVPADKQLVYSDAGEVEELKAVLDLLGGKGSVLKRFKARLVDDDKEAQKAGCYVVRIVPRQPMGNVLRVDLAIDRKTLLAQETTYWDVYGNRTRVSFSDITNPKSFDSALFKLNVPRDVAVVDSAGNPVKGGLSSSEASLTESQESNTNKKDVK